MKYDIWNTEIFNHDIANILQQGSIDSPYLEVEMSNLDVSSKPPTAT